jgi:geranylgeranyl diphosphate synthase type II
MTQSTDSPPTSFDLNAYLGDRQQRVEAALDASVTLAYPDTI